MIINPITKKRIKFGSSTFKKLLHLGYIYQLEQLPQDVLHEILNCLTMIDLMLLSQCNLYFNQYIKKNKHYQYFIKNKKLMSCGEQFTYIVHHNTLYGCGHNYNKQLMSNPEICYKPTAILNHVYAVSCGLNHSLILTSKNSTKCVNDTLLISNGLYGLGSNSHGQIAAELNINYSLPQKINLENVLSIHCGQFHSLVNTTNGLYSFGSHSCGQLGLGESKEVLKPTMIQFFNDKQILIIKCGAYHNLIYTKQGLYGFGHNVYGQLGLKNDPFYVIRPQLITIDHCDIIDMGCGYHHSVVITTQGLYVAGSNVNHQLGLLHIMQSYQFILLDIPCPICVECGQYHNLVLTKTNELYVFGDHYYGQLGIGQKNLGVPQKLNLKFNIKSISCGYTHTFIFGLDKKNCPCYYVFGTNKYGELGLGQFKNKKYFTPQLLKF
jgi:alpha-tubulin suppressor-like RCC1 family protein